MSRIWDVIHEARVKTGEAQAAHEKALAMLEAKQWDTLLCEVDDEGHLWMPSGKHDGINLWAAPGHYEVRRVDTTADPE